MNASSRHLLTRKAPAKINLSLRITGRRDDGFHEIDTLMVPLHGLSDVLTFAESDEFRFTCDSPELPADDSNLVVRAAKAFAAAARKPCRIHIHLEKHIPSGAGLGGGSSDAAATLRALQDIHGKPIREDELHAIAAAIGSDVPFFMQDGPARCAGRGEIVTPLPDILPLPLPVMLLKPTFPVATVDAYRRALDPKIGTIPGISMTAQSSGVAGISCINDLERSVFAKHRFLAELKQWLADRPEIRAALMSGSGSTVFAILKTDGSAETIPFATAASVAEVATTIARAATQEIDPTLWHWHGIAG
jgi:4-diphosphocytidyl-2-C-methyl-D-erythritol kinase